MSERARKLDELLDEMITRDGVPTLHDVSQISDPELAEFAGLANDLQLQMESIPDSPREKVLRSVVLTEIVGSRSSEAAETRRSGARKGFWFARTRRTMAAGIAFGMLVTTSAVAASDTQVGHAIRNVSHNAAQQLHFVPQSPHNRPPKGNKGDKGKHDPQSGSNESHKSGDTPGKKDPIGKLPPKDPKKGQAESQNTGDGPDNPPLGGQPGPGGDGQKPSPDGGNQLPPKPGPGPDGQQQQPPPNGGPLPPPPIGPQPPPQP